MFFPLCDECDCHSSIPCRSRSFFLFSRACRGVDAPNNHSLVLSKKEFIRAKSIFTEQMLLPIDISRSFALCFLVDNGI